MPENVTFMNAPGRQAEQPSTRDADARERVSDIQALRLRAARYRRLAASLLDARVIVVAEQCAQELEAEASMLEQRACNLAPTSR